ncbi:hypothetical protein AALP_AAs46225U000100, partial [Arabis alpina]
SFSILTMTTKPAETPSQEAELLASETQSSDVSLSELREQLRSVQRQIDALEKQNTQKQSFPPPGFQYGHTVSPPTIEQRDGKGVADAFPARFGEASRTLGYSPLEHPRWTPPDQPYRQSGPEPLTRRIEMPLFSGDNAESWVQRMEQYFELGNFSELEKLQAVRVCFLDEAWSWYQWERARNPFRSWASLRSRLLDEFSSSPDSCAGERLLTLRQTGSVKDYCREFIALATNAPEIQETTLELAFMVGLTPAIRARTKTFEPRTLKQMMGIAQRVDGWSAADESPSQRHSSGGSNESKLGQWRSSGPTNQSSGKTSYGPNITKPTNSSSFTTRTTPFQKAGYRSPNQSDRVTPPYRKLTAEEVAQRKAANQCYRCDEVGHMRHMCPKKEFGVLVVQTDGSYRELEEDKPGNPGDEGQEEPELAALSLNSIVGISSPRTMKLRGQLQSATVVVMIDSGASHNFVSTKVVSTLGLVIDEASRYGVVTGTGMTVQGFGSPLLLQLEIQEIMVRAEFLPLELGTADVILGMQWLESLGDMTVNWKLQTMKFMLNEELVKLQGDAGLCCAPISLKALWKSLADQGQGVLVEYCGLQAELHTQRRREQLPHQLLTVLEQFARVFEDPQGLPPSRGKEHNIVLEPNAKPVSVRPFRYPQAQREEVEKQVASMLAAGLIQASGSPFSSPVLLVKKKDGSWRFCVDYRALNKVTIPDSFPIPMIDQLLDELHGATIFSKLDLKSGYHQILVKAEDVAKTAFRTHDGHYEFLVMPFGLTNAPATFQSLMNDVFRGYLRKFVLVFFDDILVYSKSLQEHQQHLGLVLELLQQHQLFANKKKCEFGRTELEYLGHVVSGKGVAADPEKIQAMVSWPEPQNVKALRGFLGLTGYYRKFVQRYGEIARPLTALLKKDQFQWTAEATVAFQKLKKAMSTVPVLALVDFTEQFVVESDASGTGLGAVLMQSQRPLAYFSQALTERQRLKSVYERELMAIVFAIQKWRHYLLGRKFVVRTDQKSLKFLLEQREINMEYQKWLTKLLGFDFEIQYKPGLENKAADALSRKDMALQLCALSIPAAIQLEQINTEVDNDPDLRKLKEEVLQDAASHSEFSVVQGRLLRKGKLVVPAQSRLVNVILQEFHNGKLGGHGGVLKTQKRVEAIFYWKGMMSRIREFVAACQVCQRHKYSTLAPAGLLQPLPIPDQVWEDISMDFVEGLPKSEGFEVVMVVVDRLTKYAHFISMKHPVTAVEVALIFTKEVVKLHGFPKTIVSDRDPLFTGRFWTEMFRLAGTSLCFSTAYHPQSDGQTEVTNRGMETLLRCFSSDKPRCWVQFLHWAELCYNTSYHTAIKMSPFQAVYGREPPTLIKFETGSTSNADLEGKLRERDAMIHIIKQHILKAQQTMKNHADGHRREVVFSVGDLVFLRLKPYRQKTLAKRVNEKLAARFYGPYEVEERIGAVAYKLKLPVGSKIHNTFHVSLLKPAIGSSLEPATLPTQLTDERVLEVAPEAHMGFRIHPITGQEEVLIKWKELPEHDSTWEWTRVMAEQFPEFDLEDKVLFKAPGNVR